MGHLLKLKYAHSPLESRHFIFKKCPIYTHDGASVKFSTNSQEKDYSVGDSVAVCLFLILFAIASFGVRCD
jgi:hypothetical protein